MDWISFKSQLELEQVQFIDLRFVDLFGQWQHFSLTSQCFKEEIMNGVGFDGSSIVGFQKIEESDMLLVPDFSTAHRDTFRERPTLAVICDVIDPMTRVPYSRDPRRVAKRAEAYLKETGIASTSYWGPEVEGHLFDHVAFETGMNFSRYEIDSDNGWWNRGQSRQNGVPNLGYRPQPKQGYFPTPPHDSHQDVRSEIAAKLLEINVPVEIHHKEVSTAGQFETDLRYGTLTQMADWVLLYKYVSRAVAQSRNMTVTFMPKPLFGDNGNGMHVHSSLWNNGSPLFFDEREYASLSRLAQHYIGGILHHAPALLAFGAPTTNSYRRLTPGFEAPVHLVLSARNRSAACRIPMYHHSAQAKRVEFRSGDPLANPYLYFSAILMAGIDGIKREMEPPKPVDVDLFQLSEAELAERGIHTVPSSLDESLDALQNDHAFLLEGGVFTPDLIQKWIELKRMEADAVRLRPHPHEFELYYGS